MGQWIFPKIDPSMEEGYEDVDMDMEGGVDRARVSVCKNEQILINSSEFYCRVCGASRISLIVKLFFINIKGQYGQGHRQADKFKKVKFLASPAN